MQRNPHEGRIGTRQRIAAITASYTFDHRGVCKITMEERAALAGPWDQVGWPHADYLYIICEGSEGGVRASFSTEADWAQRMSGQDEEELN